MAIRIIATDLDGTLMAPDHLTVTQYTRQILSAAHEEGVKILISTGRTFSMVRDVIEQIPFVDYVMYSNGASVYDCSSKKVIIKNHMSSAATIKMIDFLSTYCVFYKIYSDGEVYAQKGREIYFHSDNYDLPGCFIEHMFRQINFRDDLRQFFCGRDSEIISIFYSSDSDGLAITDFLNSDNDLNTTSASYNEVESTAKAADKGIALTNICKLFNVSFDEVMCFGDAPNDCPMLRFAGYSFAMGNANELCKSAAKYIAASNADDGVAQAIEKYVLKKQTYRTNP